MIYPDKWFVVSCSQCFCNCLSDEERGEKSWFTGGREDIDSREGYSPISENLTNEIKDMVRMEACSYFRDNSVGFDVLELCIRMHRNKLFISEKSYRRIVTG